LTLFKQEEDKMKNIAFKYSVLHRLLPVALTASLLGSGLLLATPVYAQGGWGCGDKAEQQAKDGKHSGKRADGLQRYRKMADRLDFTDEQKRQLDEILQNAQPSVNIQEKQQDMRKMMMALNPEAADYDAQVASTATQMADRIKQRMLAMGQVRKQVHGILTDAQKEKMAEFMAKRQKKMRETDE
jgi:Spy/CpxP family protein refolding chaperone